MKISKKVWIDPKIKWNILRKKELCRHNRYRGHAYVVCTSPHQHLLFEIVETRFLSEQYTNATLLALCHTKSQAVKQVTELVDALYNKQTTTYTNL